ncbi:hypothetical protein GCM10011575_04760 [Microlunatus endophyticus]|uniref:Poly(Hydroxyalkanoate) granule-associated protein n=1 Tax=Microlunatus endophyticus TaxID=1716077 RepID=A0A917S179_9ACTN|nr:hypothetical protein [Microlunatus endophyticus]GGL49652.1 hypothetical protein GCM10011575_04760 [Microlunatus endophyticus]
MSKDDESRRTRLLGQTMPGYAALSEAFGAAIDGASQLTRTRAKQLAERLLTQAGLDNVDLGEAASEAGTRINQLAEEIIAARKANRALLQRTISTELERSLGRLGLARADEIAALRAEVAELRRDLDVLTVPGAAGPAKKAPAKKAPAKKAPAKKSTAKHAAAKHAAAKKAAAKKSVAAEAPARMTPATTTPATTTPAKKTAKKTPAKKAAAGGTTKTSARKSTGAGA